MSTPVVAFDEAGNSGGNLLDVEQPVFVLASVYVADDVASKLLGKCKSEFKFTKLKKSAAGRNRILDILDSPELGINRVLISAFHKPFMIITKMVDLLIEPLAYAHGIDLYERGQNLAMANMLHFAMPVYIGHKNFEKLLAAFVNMVRAPSHRTIDVFYTIIAEAYNHIGNGDFATDLAMLLQTRPIAETDMAKWNSSDLDPAIPAFIAQARMWTQELRTEFIIIHDQSRPIAQEHLIIEAMMSTTDELVSIGYDRRKMIFPIKARGIEFRDSEQFPQIQLADLLAGSTAYSLSKRLKGQQDDFTTKLLATNPLSEGFHLVWPAPKVTPKELGTEELGGIDASNYIGKYIAKKLGGIPSKGQRKKQQ